MTAPGSPSAPRPPSAPGASRPAGAALTTGLPVAGARPRPDTDRRRPPGSSPHVWRGAAAGRGLDLATLPSRWFPADREKLIYLAIAAHLAPDVLTRLVRVPGGTWFEDRKAFVTALELAPEQH